MKVAVVLGRVTETLLYTCEITFPQLVGVDFLMFKAYYILAVQVLLFYSFAHPIYENYLSCAIGVDNSVVLNLFLCSTGCMNWKIGWMRWKRMSELNVR